MSNATQETSPKKVLEDSKKAWLGNVVGGDLLYSTDTGLVATSDDGDTVDLVKLKEEVAELGDGSQLEGLAALEFMENKSLLAKYGLPSASDKATEFLNQNKAKEKALTEVRNLIELQKEEIRASTDYEVTVKKRMEIAGKEILYGSKTVQSKSGKMEKDFDSEHYKGRVVTGPSPEQKKALDLVITQLQLLMEKLKNNEEYEFSPQELMNELWTPLLREGLISEDQCPLEFSRVIQLFKGASELYNKRLEAQARKEEDKFENVRDHLDDISEVLGIGAATADIVLSLVGGSGNVQKIVKIATKCSQSGIKTASALMEKQTNYQKAGAGIADILGNVLESAIGGDKGETFGKVAKGAFNGCVSLTLFGKKMASRQYEDGLDMLAEAVGAALSCVADATDNEKLGKVANSTTSSLQGALKTGKLIYLLNQTPVDMVAVKKTIGEITSNVLKVSFRNAIDNTLFKEERDNLKSKMKGKDEDSKEYKELEEKLKKLEKSQDKDLETSDELFGEVFSSEGALMENIGKKIEENALKKGSEVAERELAEDRELFNKQLGVAFNMNVGADEGDAELISELYSIDTLIAQIERDRATLEMFNLIFDAAGALLTTFIPQLGGPLKAKAFAMNVVAAAERSYDLITFVNLVSDARKANSPQAATLLAEVDELKRHLSNDTAEAAIALGQAISLSMAAIGDLASGAMGTGAIVGVVGRAVSSGLEAFKKSKDLLKKKFEDKKTAQAWEMYKRALANPRDRRHILKTFRANPTLAKYGIAYGAIEMEDPIAKEALRQTGLNDMVLAQEGTNADKVVLFLETKFADDIKVEGVISRFAPDMGDPLTLAIWIKNKEGAAHLDNPESGRWKSEKTSAIDAAMGDVERLTSESAKKDIAKIYSPSQWKDYLAVWESYIESLKSLKDALNSFKPVTVQGMPFTQFQSYLNELASVADGLLEEANEKIKIQKGIMKSRKEFLLVTITNGEQGIKLIDAAVPNFGSPNDRKHEELLNNVLKSGVAADLLKSLQDKSQLVPRFSTSVDFLRHSIEGGIRKVDRAAKAPNDSAKLVITADIVRTLLASAADCRAGIEDEVKAAKVESEQLASIAV